MKFLTFCAFVCSVLVAQAEDSSTTHASTHEQTDASTHSQPITSGPIDQKAKEDLLKKAQELQTRLESDVKACIDHKLVDERELDVLEFHDKSLKQLIEEINKANTSVALEKCQKWYKALEEIVDKELTRIDDIIKNPPTTTPPTEHTETVHQTTGAHTTGHKFA